MFLFLFIDEFFYMKLGADIVHEKRARQNTSKGCVTFTTQLFP